ncbi:MAG: glycosyltransferase [Pleurocapsa minor HA4230-MV1]|jgi:glycosyltransferase involved in cell wall biosynthesis|nr:glycosyltransferase [Pleurocapsa minor HA4230-MV1]
MNFKPLTSVIINNYNYKQFLSQAIDSVLSQSYLYTEIIVVDDGSNDSSREIIADYGTRVIPLLKENGGQASALNAGFAASKGEIIFFLDADDVFISNKVEELLKLFTQIIQHNPDAMISNYIQPIDEKGLTIDIDILNTLSTINDWRYLSKIRGKKNKLIDKVITKLSTPEQVYQFAVKYRFIPYLGMPTSGIAMTRSLAKKIFPIPSESIKTSADDFVVKGASLIGTVYLTNHVLTKYRIHGKNSWYGNQNLLPETYFNILDDFLNLKLISTGRKEVFSYFSSIHAKGYYRAKYKYQCSYKLIDLALKVVLWHINLMTISFFLKTVYLAIIFGFKKRNKINNK